MDERYTPILSDEERAALRAQRVARRKAAQQARRRKLLRQLLPVGAVLLVLVVLLVGRATRGTKEEPEPEAPAAATFTVESVPPEPEPLWAPVEAVDTIRLDDTLPSTYAVVIARSSGNHSGEKFRYRHQPRLHDEDHDASGGCGKPEKPGRHRRHHH